MSLASSLLALVPSAGHVLAGVIPNPAPADPAAGSNGITLLISYVKWGAVTACGISVVASGGLLALGSLSNRPDHADKGKRGLDLVPGRGRRSCDRDPRGQHDLRRRPLDR